MNRLFFLVVLLLATHASALPRPTVKAPSSNLKHDVIYNGTLVSPNGTTWRSTVQLVLGDQALCTGVVFQSRVILTAAHCVRGFSGGDLTVVFFEGSSKRGEMTFGSSEFVATANPSYRTLQVENDFAVIVLARDMEVDGWAPDAVEQVTTSTASILDFGQKVYVIGNGDTEANGNQYRNETLYFTTGTIYSGFGAELFLQAAASTGVCHGDSGGPVFGRIEGRFVLIGLTSAMENNIGSNCGSTIHVALLSEPVDTWIREQISQAEQRL